MATERVVRRDCGEDVAVSTPVHLVVDTTTDALTDALLAIEAADMHGWWDEEQHNRLGSLVIGMRRARDRELARKGLLEAEEALRSSTDPDPREWDRLVATWEWWLERQITPDAQSGSAD